MSKQKKFQAPQGFIVAVHQNIFGCVELAKELKSNPVLVAEALERAGVMLVPDPMDISADTAKVLKIEHAKSGGSTTKLEVVADEPNSNATND